MTEPGAVLHVAEFAFESASGSLWRAGREVTPRPKTSAVLAEPALRAGEVVGKDDLLRAARPDGFVGEAALTVCVSELRRVSGDSSAVVRRWPRCTDGGGRRGTGSGGSGSSPRRREWARRR